MLWKIYLVNIMGGGNSKTGRQELNTVHSTIKETTMNVMNKNQTNVSQQATNIQSLVISNTEFICAGAEIGNEATIDMTAEITIDASLSTELITGIQQELDNKIDQDQSASTGFGAGLTSMGGGNTSTGDIVTNIKTEIKDTLDTTLTQENLTEIIQSAYSEQTLEADGLTFDPCGTRMALEMYYKAEQMRLEVLANAGGDASPALVQMLTTEMPSTRCDLPCGSITNISKISLAADAVTDAVMDALVSNQTISNVYNDVAMSSVAEVAGVEDVVDSIWSGATGFLSAGLSGLLIPIILAIVGFVILAIVFKKVIAKKVGGRF